MRRAVVVLLVSVVVLVATSSCKRKPVAGGRCFATGSVCGDPTTRLTCVGGKYDAIPCRGPKGCRDEAATNLSFCDTNLSQEGDACDEDNSHACSMDGTAMLVCSNKVWKSDSICRGTKHCRADANPATPLRATIRCDQSLGAVGDVCSKDDTAACTADKKARLKCKNGKLAADIPCHGPNGCTVESKADDTIIRCDVSRAELGDPCDASDEGAGTCSPDGKAAYQCKAKKFVEWVSCPGAKGCSIDGGKINCDGATSGAKPKPKPRR